MPPPLFSAAYSTNVRLGTPVSFCENSLRFLAAPNRRNLPVGKLAVPVVEAIVVSALLCCIGIVLGVRTKAQMLWIYARRIVALVHYNHSIRNGAIENLTGMAVRPHLNLSWEKKNPVPIVISGTSPKPACFGFFNPIFKNIAWLQNWVTSESAVLGALVVAPTAKLSANSIYLIASNADNFPSGLIAHRASI